jgi:hypothetical protein
VVFVPFTVKAVETVAVSGEIAVADMIKWLKWKNNLSLITYQKYDFKAQEKQFVADNQLVTKLLTTIWLDDYSFPLIALRSKTFEPDKWRWVEAMVSGLNVF